jgi:RHS repeat-associated protein
VSASTAKTSSGTGYLQSSQQYDPWGKVRLTAAASPPYGTGEAPISQTARGFTGQRLDDSGLMHYNARLYDPALGRFVSADTIVPGSASGSMQGVAAKPLTVAFHETGFLGMLNSENRGGSDAYDGGPLNPQALNRYSYVQNNPVKYTDPSGHYLSFNRDQAGIAWERLTNLRTQMLNGETKDFDWLSVAEDFLSAVFGLVEKAAKASVLLAPLAELLSYASVDTDGRQMRVIEYLIQELDGYMQRFDRLVDLGDSDPRADIRIAFWFTQKDLGYGNTEYLLHSSWGGIESDGPRTSLRTVVGALHSERVAWSHVVNFIGYYDADYI